MSEDAGRYETAEPSHSRTRLGPSGFALLGVLFGLVVGFGAAWAVGGNPLSARNEVSYREVVVNSVSAAADQLCWADDPDRRDSPQTCAILALDPALEVPEEGDTVVIGLVELDTPDGAEFTQVVHVAAPPPREAEPDEDDEADGDGSG
jgi:hypothetical protein